jgi:hypothetical protein
MNSTIQPGMHPDAESLTAFAEQALPAAEREQILAHMAVCSRCREVMFLAQRAAGEDAPRIFPVYAEEPSKPGRRWFASWRWTWVPAAALAGIVGVAVVLHFHHAAQPEPQVAARLGPTSTLRNAEPVQAAPTSSAAPEAAQQAKEKAPASSRRIVPREIQKDAAKQLDEKKPAEERDEAAVGGTGGAMGAIGGLTGGSTHGMVTARAKSQSPGGPMAANQFQQNANQLQQQNLIQQNAAQAPQNEPVLKADKPVTVNAASGSATQTVTVQAETPQAAPAPATPMTLSSVANETLEVNGRHVADMKKLKKIALPSGVGVLSSASAAGRTIALDTAGALFVREDNQQHWQPVPAQWTGRAVLVRVRPTSATAQSALSLGIVQNPRFELVTDKLQTWVSTDGKTWTTDPLPGK